MDSINEKKTAESFPFESLYRLRNTIPIDGDTASDFSARSYDNRSRISDVAESLRARLGYFQTRLSANSFLSSYFSWQVKTATSSDTSILLGKATTSADETDFSVEIDTVATVRTARSQRLVSDDVSAQKTGTYAYTLIVGDQAYSIELEIDNDPKDPLSNRSVLRDVERSINRLGAGVTATLEDRMVKDYNPYRENAYKKVSMVTLKNDASGDDTGFSLSDVTGTLIADLDLDTVSHFGAQNHYRVNGNAGSDDSNQVTIDSGKIGAYLLDSTDENNNAKISVKQDRTALTNELTQVIDDFNQLIQWIDDNESIISPSLKTQLFKNVSSLNIKNKSIILTSLEDNSQNHSRTGYTGFSTRLDIENDHSIDSDFEAIGLTLNKNGTINIGTDFAQSVSSRFRQVYDTLAGKDGFFTQISNNIDTIHGKNTNNYVFAFNSIMSYDPQGINRQSVYKNSISSIVNLFV
jgi:hypothetical protein